MNSISGGHFSLIFQNRYLMVGIQKIFKDMSNKNQFFKVLIILVLATILKSEESEYILSSGNDSIQAVSLRKDKEWFPQCERLMPLLLPKRVIAIQPYLSFDISLEPDSDYRMNEDESFKSIFADVILSPSNKLDITVLPFPGIEVALLNKVSISGRLLYLNEQSLSIGACIYDFWRDRTPNEFQTIKPSFVIYHRYYSRYKQLTGKRSWVLLKLSVDLANNKYSAFQGQVYGNYKFNKFFYGIAGINFKDNHFTKEWMFFRDDYDKRLNGEIGFYLNINRHIRLQALAGAGKDLENNAFVGLFSFMIRGIW